MARPVVVTGGGTGGHVFPMVAVAAALRRLNGGRPVRFIGSRRGQERTLLAGEDLTLLPGRGIRRALSPSALLQNAGAVLGLGLACLGAVLALVRHRPAAVVSLGGYAAAPTDLAAALLGVPLVTVDPDVVPSRTHRLVGRRATVRCGAFPAPGVVVTGVPLRPEIETLVRPPIAERRRPGDRWRIVVMTGSLGARSVNLAVAELADRWRDRADVEIVHVTGTRDAQLVAERFQPRTADQLSYRAVSFAEMAPLWASCDVAVCRAGAVTVAELSVLGIPAVLVPLPHAPDDHQRKNAQAVAHAGGAVVVEDRSISGVRLAAVLDELLDEPTLDAMERGMRTLGRRGGADAIAAEVRRVARG